VFRCCVGVSFAFTERQGRIGQVVRASTHRIPLSSSLCCLQNNDPLHRIR
jgi:hypothetical protein